MSFHFAGFRAAVLGSAVALVLALSTTTLMAQEAPPPAAAANAATPTVAEAAVKPGDPAAGQAKAAVCGACHGQDGNSPIPLYPKLAGQSEQYTVRQLTDFKSGVRQNPIMLGMAAPLSTQDMHDLGAYFASQKSQPGVADQALVERGQTLYREGDTTRYIPACMGCHGMDGRGNPGARYPQLAGQHAQYTEATLKAWHDGTTWGDDIYSRIMPEIAVKLDAEDIAALASYIEGLHGTDSQTPATTP